MADRDLAALLLCTTLAACGAAQQPQTEATTTPIPTATSTATATATSTSTSTSTATSTSTSTSTPTPTPTSTPASSSTPASTSTPPETAASSSPPPPPPHEPTGTRIALLVAKQTRAALAASAPAHAAAPAQPLAPPEQPLVAPSASPFPPRSLADLKTNNSCGARDNCGAQVQVKQPTAKVLVGLVPKPGVEAKDAGHARGAIALLAHRTSMCMRAGLAMNPTLPNTTMNVEIKADGVASPVVNFAKPYDSEQVQSCIRRAIQLALGADTAPASISFPIWIDVVQ